MAAAHDDASAAVFAAVSPHAGAAYSGGTGAQLLAGAGAAAGGASHDQEALRKRWNVAIKLAQRTGHTALEAAHALEVADDDDDTAETLLKQPRPDAHLGVLTGYIHAGPWVYKVGLDLRGTRDEVKAAVRYLYIAKQRDGSGLDDVPYGRAVLPTPEDDAAWEVRALSLCRARIWRVRA